MSVRLLVMLVILAVPVQGFAVPHAHGPRAGTQSKEHSHRAHLHLGSHHHHHPSVYDDGHSHAPHCGSDSDGEPKLVGLASSTSPRHHDDGALYLSSELGLNLTQPVQDFADAGLILWSDLDPSIGIDTRAYVDEVACCLARGDTPLYLTTLSLRL